MTDAPLSSPACAGCGTAPPEDARFCPHCGAHLGGDGAPPEGSPSITVARGERRVYGLGWVSLSSWSHASREVVRLRSRQRRLRREQRALIRSLGDAVYGEQRRRAAELKAQAREREEQIDECARELLAALEVARERVSRERLAIQPTEVASGARAEALRNAASKAGG